MNPLNTDGNGFLPLKAVLLKFGYVYVTQHVHAMPCHAICTQEYIVLCTVNECTASTCTYI